MSDLLIKDMSKILTLDEMRERLGLVQTDTSKNLQSSYSANTYENCANLFVFLDDKPNKKRDHRYYATVP